MLNRYLLFPSQVIVMPIAHYNSIIVSVPVTFFNPYVMRTKLNHKKIPTLSTLKMPPIDICDVMSCDSDL